VGPDKWCRHCSCAKDLGLQKCYSISERKKKREKKNAAGVGETRGHAPLSRRGRKREEEDNEAGRVVVEH
jgi:hypothetical protein